MITFQSFSGQIDPAIITELAKLRIRVFHDFPYLYDGHMDYELEYLQTYVHTPESVVVVAFDGDQVIGASTGIPMSAETENIRQPWLKRGYDVEKIFYYGESVLQKAYRGKGIGVAFFEHRERWARTLGRFDTCTFCSVVRPDDHPLKPAGHQPLDAFWCKRGFEKTADLQCSIAWKDIDEPGETEKALHFWVKRL